MYGICRICGNIGEGKAFAEWVADTFTNYGDLRPGDVVCEMCLFWFDQRSVELQERLGKDKPQKMQNYSHFIVNGQWMPVSKGDKAQMARLLVGFPFPELAAVAVSGQKHLAFRARRNPRGYASGWVQFEEQAVWVDSRQFTVLLKVVEELYTGFLKAEIETGRYAPRRVLEFGLERWDKLEQQIKELRQTTLFQLGLFLAQRSDDGDQSRVDGDAAQDHLAGDTAGLQEQVQDDHLAAVRERDPGGGIHEQPGAVRQLALFPPEG